MQVQLERRYDEALNRRVNYGGAGASFSVEGGVMTAFLRGPITDRVAHRVAADIGSEQAARNAYGAVAFLDRCVLSLTADELYDATMTQVIWGRLCRPCALVGVPDSMPMLRDYADQLGARGVIREVFPSSDAFAALRWAQERADVYRRQAIYLSRTSAR